MKTCFQLWKYTYKQNLGFLIFGERNKQRTLTAEAHRNTSLNHQLVGFITVQHPLMPETCFVMPMWNGPTVTALTGNKTAI
jgi:hypothetical protein